MKHKTRVLITLAILSFLSINVQAQWTSSTSTWHRLVKDYSHDGMDLKVEAGYPTSCSFGFWLTQSVFLGGGYAFTPSYMKLNKSNHIQFTTGPFIEIMGVIPNTTHHFYADLKAGFGYGKGYTNKYHSCSGFSGFMSLGLGYGYKNLRLGPSFGIGLVEGGALDEYVAASLSYSIHLNK